MNRLRSVLGDDPNRPSYLETVVGLGYRFIAPVEVVDLDQSPTTEVDPRKPEGDLLPGGTELLSGTETTASPSQTEPMDTQAPLPPETVAATQGWEKPHVPVKTFGRESWAAPLVPFSLAVLALSGALVWFARSRLSSAKSTPVPLTKRELYLVQATSNDSDNPIFAAAISHSGASFAYSDDSGVSVRTIETGSDQILHTPAHLHVYQMQWLPDDSTVIASGVLASSGAEQVWALSLHSDAAQLLLENAGGAAVSPDGSHLAFTRRHGEEIWTSLISGASAHLLTSVPQEDTFSSLVWTATGDRILCQSRRPPSTDLRGDTYTNRRAFQDLALFNTNGAQLASWPDLKLSSPVLRKNGQLVFLQSEAPFPHPDPRLMMAHLDPFSPELLTADPIRIGDIEADDAVSFSLSEDASRFGLVLERRSANVYVGRIRSDHSALEAVRELSHPAPDNYPHAWTAASDAVIFESNSLGPYAIFKQQLDGTPAKLIARSSGDAVFAQTSPDGRWILFENFLHSPKYHVDAIFRVPVSGGKIEQLMTKGQIDGFQCSSSSNGLCILRQRIANEWVYSVLDPLRGQMEELRRSPWQDSFLGDWNVSPDGATVALPFHNAHETGIRLLPLSRRASSSQLSPLQKSTYDPFTIPIRVRGDIVQVTWAADGQSFFAELQANDGYSLLAVDRTGNFTTLRRSEAVIWAVPSRDGKLLATIKQDTNSNVWLGSPLPSNDVK